jgi:hypothetical protein
VPPASPRAAFAGATKLPVRSPGAAAPPGARPASPTPIPASIVYIEPVDNPYMSENGFSTTNSALAVPNWHDTMTNEYTAIQINHTWDLVTHPTSVNVVTGKWVYCHKHHQEGTLIATKFVGFSTVFLSSQVLILVRPSV